jgi:hypothetical protein
MWVAVDLKLIQPLASTKPLLSYVADAMLINYKAFSSQYKHNNANMAVGYKCKCSISRKTNVIIYVMLLFLW